MPEPIEKKVIDSLSAHVLSKDIFPIPIEYGGTRTIYKMKQLSSDDYWTILYQTQKIDEGPDGEARIVVDQPMRNKIFLSKSIIEPTLTIESVSNMPIQVTNILLSCFNMINSPDPELLKKTLEQFMK